MQVLSIWDLVLTPIFFLIFLLIGMAYRNKHYPPGHPLRKLFIQGLMVKFLGAIFIGLVYEFYYGGGGDSFNYFLHCKILNSSLQDSVNTWVQLLFRVSPADVPRLYPYASQMEWYTDPSSFMVVRFGSVFGLLSGTTYMPIALCFAGLAYTGIWAMYTTFIRLYPNLYKPLAVAFLFIPSIAVWGSGLYKDTLCMFALGWLTYGAFKIFVNRKFSIKNLFVMLMGGYFLGVIKVYILLAFLPALSLWLLLTYSSKIQSGALRFMVWIFFVAATGFAFLTFSRIFATDLNKYSLDNIASTSATTRNWINYSSGDEGSAYDLGEFDPTLVGMLSKLPAAVVVTLFRPFPWEARKVIVFLSALEAILFLLGTVWIFAKLGVLKVIRKVLQDPNLTFFFAYSVIFAFAVGISSYNFGTLSRYKIPCLPFYTSLLIILYYSSRAQAAKAQSSLRS